MKKIFTLFAAVLFAGSMMADPLPANQVRAVYSDVYSVDCGFGEWGSGTQYSQETGYKHYVLAGGGYFGLTFEDRHLNCSQMESFHMEINPTTECTVRIVPIHGGVEQGVFTSTLTAGEWNTVDIAITEGDWATVTDWSDVYQVKIDNASNLTFDLREVYFYTTKEIGPDPEPEMDLEPEGDNVIGSIVIDETYYNPGWGGVVATSIATLADDKITVTLPTACTQQWQAQVKVNYGVNMIDGNNYKMSAMFKSSKDIMGVTFKMSDTCNKTFNLKANKEWRIVLDGAYMASMANQFVFDFGSTPADNVVEIYDIKLVGEVDDPQGLHNVEVVKAIKTVENGKVVILKNGVRYNVLGAQL